MKIKNKFINSINAAHSTSPTPEDAIPKLSLISLEILYEINHKATPIWKNKDEITKSITDACLIQNFSQQNAKLLRKLIENNLIFIETIRNSLH